MALLRVGTFNVVAPCNRRLEGRQKESACQALFTARAHHIIDLLETEPRVDVWCLQDVWFELTWLEIFETRLKDRYQIIRAKRPGTKQEGLCIFVSNEYKVELHQTLFFNDVTQQGVLWAVLASPSGCRILIVNAQLVRGKASVVQQLREAQATALAKAVESACTTMSLGQGEPLPAIVAGDIVNVSLGTDFKPAVPEGIFTMQELATDTILLRDQGILQPCAWALLPSDCPPEACMFCQYHLVEAHGHGNTDHLISAADTELA